MAGVAGAGATIGGAERGCGTILRGSGRAGGCAGLRGNRSRGGRLRGWRGGLGRRGRPASPAFARGAPLLPLPSSWPGGPSSHRRAWRCAKDRSWDDGFRAVASGCAPACVPCRASRTKCARTFSASSSSSELECVLPAETPSSGRTSRIARDFTSSSFARSLIRTLLIRLFSILCRQKALSRS
jgi:hypothetical protein